MNMLKKNPLEVVPIIATIYYLNRSLPHQYFFIFIRKYVNVVKG